MVSTLIKQRIKGTGPDRKNMPNWQKLVDIDNETFNQIRLELLTVIDVFKDVDDIADSSSDYPIADSKIVRLAEKVPQGYKGITLQWANSDAKKNTTILDESPYTEWNERAELAPTFVNFMKKNFPGAYRTRLSCLPPNGGELTWHIDSNTSVTCRAQIPITHDITPNGATFEMKRNGVHEYANHPMQGVYFINAGFLHRVVNNTNTERWVVNFSTDYTYISKYMEK